VAIIRGIAAKQHALAKGTQGLFQCVERADCPDLMSAAEQIEKSIGCARSLAVLEFVGRCKTKVLTDLARTKNALAEGYLPNARVNRDQVDALRRVAESGSIQPVATAVDSLLRLPGDLYRRELLDEMRRALAECTSGSCNSLSDAAWTVRQRTRYYGRKLDRRVVGSTFLLKGLEFDHVVVMDADDLDVKNLYVAITRGSHSLTVVSRTQVLYPASRRRSD
jgi:DNA helicase-2/ATP-dependent DNA helicase PcrA